MAPTRAGIFQLEPRLSNDRLRLKWPQNRSNGEQLWSWCDLINHPISAFGQSRPLNQTSSYLKEVFIQMHQHPSALTYRWRLIRKQNHHDNPATRSGTFSQSVNNFCQPQVDSLCTQTRMHTLFLLWLLSCQSASLPEYLTCDSERPSRLDLQADYWRPDFEHHIT